MDDRLHSLFRPMQANGRVPSNHYVEVMPSPILKPYVCCYWASEPIENPPSTGCDGVDRVLPDGCTDILFEHDLHRNCYRVRYCGMFDHCFTIAYDKERPIRKFGVRFFPGGAHGFLRMPLAEFTNDHFPLDLIWTGIAEEIGEKIFQAPSLAAKIQVMEHYLISMLKANEPASDAVTKNLLYRIFVSGGQATVRELAEAEAISCRQMNRKFDRWIGFSPKRFSEIVRFQNVISDIRTRRIADWRTLALDNGFFDQAHLIRDFKQFYDDTPTVAAAEYRSMSDLYNS